MDRIERRGALKTRPSPDSRLDCVSTLEGRTGISPVRLRYVPDKLVMEPESFALYLKSLDGLAWDSLEETAMAILDDINNEVVARWTQITLCASDGRASDGDAGSHSVMVEDRQPKWDNSTLLSRLRRS